MREIASVAVTVLVLTLSGSAQRQSSPKTEIVATPAAKSATQARVRGMFPIGIWMDGRVEGINCPPGCVNVPRDLTQAEAYYGKAFTDIRDHDIEIVVVPNTPPEYRQLLLDVADRVDVKIVLEIVELSDPQIGGDLSVRSPNMVADDKALYDRLKPVIEPLRRHPSLWAYQVADEPPATLAPNVIRANRALRKLDAHRFPFSCLCNASELTRTVKMGYPMVVFDWYPLYESSAPGSYPFTNWLVTCDTIRSHAEANGLPYWMVIQAFAKPGAWRTPTAGELRAMTYLSIARNAKGIFFFLYNSDSQEEHLEGLVDSELRPTPLLDEAGRIAKDLKRIGPVLAQLDPAPNIASTGGPLDVRTFAQRGGARYIFAANTDTVNAVESTGTIGGPAPKKIKRLTDVSTGENVPLQRDTDSDFPRFTLRLEPGEGRLLRVVTPN